MSKKIDILFTAIRIQIMSKYKKEDFKDEKGETVEFKVDAATSTNINKDKK